MTTLETGLKMIFALCALLGYMLSLRVRYNLPFCLGPAVVCAGISVLLTLAGILGLLDMGVYVLAGGGWSLLLFFGWKQRKKWRGLFVASNLFLLFSILYACIRLDGLLLKHYDNFSHWALVVDQMLRSHALPSPQNPLILFTSYPPGGACFIYFFARLAGPMESVMAVGQAVWLASAMAPFFFFVQKNKALGHILIVLSYISMLICNIFITELLVDTLLPMVSLSGLTVPLALRSQPKKRLLCALPIVMSLSLIKNSGLFFALLTCVLLVRLAYREQGKKAALWTSLFSFGGLALTQTLWSLHVLFTFVPGTASKHGFSLAAFTQNFGEKLASGNLWQIVKNFVRAGLSSTSTPVIMGLFLGLILLWLAKRRIGAEGRAVRQAFLATAVVFAVWQICLLGMYLFSASPKEALNTSGYQRYTLSIAIYAMGLVLLLQLRLLAQMDLRPLNRQTLPVQMLTVLLTLYPFWSQRAAIPYLWRDLADLPCHAVLQKVQDKARIPAGKQVRVYVESFREASYTSFVARYVFQTSDVKIIDGSWYEQAFQEYLQDGEYLVFYEWNPAAFAYAEELSRQEGLTNLQVLVSDEAEKKR